MGFKKQKFHLVRENETGSVLVFDIGAFYIFDSQMYVVLGVCVAQDSDWEVKTRATNLRRVHAEIQDRVLFTSGNPLPGA